MFIENILRLIQTKTEHFEVLINKNVFIDRKYKCKQMDGMENLD